MLRPLPKPDVKPGDWIDTGRYRPAQVLSINDDPPNIMSLSYGDEIDDDFRPHVSDWKAVSISGQPPSLRNVFSPGDWIRHYRFGYGEVVSVRDVRMEVSFAHRVRTLIPDAKLSKIEKVAEPEPVDSRPFHERFPPGSWIDREGVGIGMIVKVEGDRVTVLDSQRLSTWVLTDDSPVFWKVDRAPLDLSLPREKRRMWWWQIGKRNRPCPCCGYPNLGVPDDFIEVAAQCVICGWMDEWIHEHDADIVTSVPDPDDPFDWEWPNWGYSLTEGRQNFDAYGVMFRRDDPRALPFEQQAETRARLIRELDEILADGTPVGSQRWTAIVILAGEITTNSKSRT